MSSNSLSCAKPPTGPSVFERQHVWREENFAPFRYYCLSSRVREGHLELCLVRDNGSHQIHGDQWVHWRKLNLIGVGEHRPGRVAGEKSRYVRQALRKEEA